MNHSSCTLTSENINSILNAQSLFERGYHHWNFDRNGNSPLFASFQQLLEDNHFIQPSSLIQNESEILSKHGLSPYDPFVFCSADIQTIIELITFVMVTNRDNRGYLATLVYSGYFSMFFQRLNQLRQIVQLEMRGVLEPAV